MQLHVLQVFGKVQEVATDRWQVVRKHQSLETAKLQANASICTVDVYMTVCVCVQHGHEYNSKVFASYEDGLAFCLQRYSDGESWYMLERQVQ
jgi:hypothetical protein